MTTDTLPARWVVLASFGLAMLLTGLAAAFAPAWTLANLAVPVLLGVGLPPVVALGALLRLWWRSETTRLWLDEIKGNAQILANKAEELRQRTVSAILSVDDDQPEAQAWVLPLETFFRAGDSAGSFSIRALSGCVGSTTWAMLTDFYSSDAGRRVLRVEPGDAGTVWGHGWGLDLVLQQLALGKLPHPGGAVPEIKPYVRDTTRRPSKRHAATVVIDNKTNDTVA